MLNFSTLLLRSYYAATGWNEDNMYSNITRSSSALLDFPIPDSLVLQLAKSPTPVFFTSYALDALPQLNGSVSYITTSEPVTEIGPSRDVRFQDVVERFRVFPPPRRPAGKDQIWQGGKRVEGRDYLLYSRLHFPTLHLSGLATTRLSPTLQAQLVFINQPTPSRVLSAPAPHSPSHRRQPSDTASSSAGGGSASPPQPAGNVLFSLQHDTGRYSGEYTYSAQDGMFGWRGMYNFGWLDRQAPVPTAVSGLAAAVGAPGAVEQGQSVGEDGEGVGVVGGKRIDEEEMMDGGLRGRFSAGGEVYFSAKQRSFGISTGVRFTTIPPTLPLSPRSPPPSPPTTLSLLYNPLIGYLSTAYAAQVSPTVSLSSRFGVNVYSYESDLAIGGEWWVGRRRAVPVSGTAGAGAAAGAAALALGAGGAAEEQRTGVSAAQRGERAKAVPVARLRSEEEELAGVVAGSTEGQRSNLPPRRSHDDERDGVLKARLSGNWSIGLLYEARIRNCLVSIGVVSDILSRQKPIRSVGVEVQYFS